MKRRIFCGLSFLLFFLRLPIYESIAAIFWQSASYVYDDSFKINHARQLYSITTAVLSK